MSAQEKAHINADSQTRDLYFIGWFPFRRQISQWVVDMSGVSCIDFIGIMEPSRRHEDVYTCLNAWQHVDRHGRPPARHVTRSVASGLATP